MFDLDIWIFNFMYNSCKHLGSTFGYGAFEGLVMYLGIILLGIYKGIEMNRKKAKK